MKRRCCTVILAALTLGGASQRAEARQLRIVATTPDLGAIAREIAGASAAEVNALLLPTQDPHFADARPHLALLLNRADLLVLVGLELEVGWLPTLIGNARNPRIQKNSEGTFDASTAVALKEVPRERVDRGMGDIHPGGNPHYLLDPHNAIRVARALAERLVRLEPVEAAGARARAASFASTLEAARKRWLQQLAPYKGTPVVAYHRSWIYLTDTLGLKIVAELEPKPGIPPSAAHVLSVVQTMRAQKVPLILQEQYFPDRTAQLIAQKTGAQLCVLPGGANFRGGQTFAARLDATVGKLVEALRRARK